MTSYQGAGGISKTLLAAQEQLDALRAAHQAHKQALNPQPSSDPRPITHQAIEHSPAQGIGESLVAACNHLPDHLGWGSTRLTTIIRANRTRQMKADHQARWYDALAQPAPAPAATDLQPTTSPRPQEIKLYPAIALAILRNKKAAAGRIWLLLRHLDQTGCGWTAVEEAQDIFCLPTSPTRLCGKRQLRNLLHQGEGIFWDRRDGRLWIRSLAKVAFALGLHRLSGRPVAFPVQVLTQPIGTVRAHLYASFHSGRPQNMPIARQSLARISQVSPRAQRDYDRRAGVSKQRNFALGPRLDSPQGQEQAWQRGPAAFPWTPKNQSLLSRAARLAWQLPNSYSGPFEQRSRGRQKQINRQLADLFNQGKTGNGRLAVERQSRCFFSSAKTAVASGMRDRRIVYWPDSRMGLWYPLG